MYAEYLDKTQTKTKYKQEKRLRKAYPHDRKQVSYVS